MVLPLFHLAIPVSSLWLLLSPKYLDSSSSSFLSLEVPPIPPALLLAIELFIIPITANTSSHSVQITHNSQLKSVRYIFVLS